MAPGGAEAAGFGVTFGDAEGEGSGSGEADGAGDAVDGAGAPRVAAPAMAEDVTTAATIAAATDHT